MTSFSLRALKLRSGEQFQDEIAVQLVPLQFGGQRYLPVPEQVPVELRATRASTGTVFDLSFDARLHGPCQRCLRDTAIDRSISVQEYHASSPAADEELRSEYVADDKLDLSGWARDALVLDLPAQILHDPDCAGLCPTCGKNLNEEPHTHEEETSDSRWAALEALRERL